MAVLHFVYNMEINYEEMAGKCYFTIKCIPREDTRQHLLYMDISILPECNYSYGKDSFGNKQVYGCIEKAHNKFVLNISGDVEIIQKGYEYEECNKSTGMYCFPYGKCIPGQGLLNYYSSFVFTDCNNSYDTCIYIMNKLYQDFSYVPESTNVETTAEDAWNLGRGVCQDYAHIYISLLRLAGIPARYVCGLVIGEGESHAWAEALCNGKWTGFDPANNCFVLDNYIKLGDGRDAKDCAINRGIMWGGGRQSQKVSVIVQKND